MKYPSRRLGTGIAAATGMLLAGFGVAGIIPARALFGAWLAAWWTGLAVVLGAQMNLWLHTITGGRWGWSLRDALNRAASAMPILTLLALPLLAGIDVAYPWTTPGWADELAQPAFKKAWLNPTFFVVRCIAYLIVWNVLIGLSRRGAFRASRGFAAVGLIVTSFTTSLAAVDLLMSLMPVWYSSGFGLVVLTAHMKAGMAWCVSIASLHAPASIRRDFGNLLLMYVLIVMALAFVEFQIIWAENLPHEISWYVPRMQTGWRWLGVSLALAGFFLPMLLLLFRSNKTEGRRLSMLAAALLAVSAAESAWLVLPSLSSESAAAAWAMPLALCAVGFAMVAAVPRSGGPPPSTQGDNDG